MAQIIQVFTDAQKLSLQSLVDAKNYPAAYRFVSDLSDDEKVANWLDTAAHINANDNTFYSNFVRSATMEASLDSDKSVNAEQFQNASDQLAEGVLRGMISSGGIYDLDTIISKDVKSVVMDIGLNPEGWAGTFMADWPRSFGGLGLEDDGQFYQDLQKDWESRGIDSWYERSAIWADVLENNMVGFVDAGAASVKSRYKTTISFLDNLYSTTTSSINQSISTSYTTFSNSVTNAIVRVDPLIIDLNGDGLKLSSWQESGVTFDLNGDGFSESTGWTTASSDDAFLVLDKNSNGNVDSIDELFGNSSSTGFEVLGKFDSNADNLINSNDAQFNLLKLWKDSNSNGVVNEGELTSLTDNGITEISLKTLNNLYSSSGNLVTETAEVKITDSQTNIVSTRTISEVLFAMNQFNSSIVNPDEALGPNFTLDVNTLLLPYSRGYGSLNSWQVAMTLNSELLETAQTLANLSPTNFYQINSLFETFLFQWAGVEDFTSAQVYESGTSTKIDHRKVAFLEKATGLDFRVPNDAVISQAQTSWDLFYNTLLTRFLTQGTFKEIFPDASYSFSTDTTSINTSLDEAITNILSLSVSLDRNSFLNYAYYSKTILQLNKDQFTSETNTSFDTKVNDMLNSIINSVSIPNFSFNGIFNIGTDASETLYGAVNSDILKGESGEDFIYAESGNDYIEGNEGSDYLKGGAGDDIYKFNLGDGQDTIEETSGTDKIVFGSSITQTSLAFVRIGVDLLISIGSGSDKIGIKNFYSATTSRGETTLNQTLFIQKVIAQECSKINKNEFFQDQNYA